MSMHLVPILAPAGFIVAALMSFREPGKRPTSALAAASAASVLALAAALVSALLLVVKGSATVATPFSIPVSLAVRVDAVSVIMMLLISLVGWVVLRFSATYLDGEDRQGTFTGWLCATLAAVLTLVQAGSLTLLVFAWVAMSLCLHRLLLFYPDRPGAQRAARKKFIFARTGDLALALAAVFLVVGFGTDDIGAILEAARAGTTPQGVTVAAGLIALAAVLKSAQFPTHGWLTEVMEAPTPVSALLHAGVINAGGFLLIRLADVMLLAPGVLAFLVILGGFTALFGCVVMLTMPAVKTSLAWSTVGQMGFMVMQCGLALFPLALLHIVAHSLYKAHAFLSSGNAVAYVASIRRPGPIAVPSLGAVSRAFAMGLGIYLIVGLFFGFYDKSPQAIAVGALLVFGVAYLLAQGLADAAPGALTRRTVGYSVAASIAYFGLQSFSIHLLTGTLPPTPSATALEWVLIILAVSSFGFVAFAQALFPLWATHPAATGLRVHVANGLYVNAVIDRMLQNLSTKSPWRPKLKER